MVCFGTAPARTAEWDGGYDADFRLERGSRFKSMLAEVWQRPDETDECCDELAAQKIEACFMKLADEWEQEVSNISSLTAIVAHPKYREIVDMKWRVVPFLISDLQRKRRFWLPALEEITGIQPFDPGDSGNTKRMIDAWVRGAKKK